MAGLAVLLAIVGLAAQVGLRPLVRVSGSVVPVLDEKGVPLAETERAPPLRDLDFVTILVVGLDSVRHVDLPPTPDTRFADIPLQHVRGRSDVVLLVGLDRRNHTIRLLHVPRDTIIDLPERGRDKLGELMAYGSFFELKKAVEDITQMPAYRYVVVDFEGFKTLVDAVGGVTVTVDHDLLSPDGIWLPRGTHDLDGERSLRLVRHRYGELQADIARIRLQHTFLVALGRKLASGGLWSALAAYRQSPGVAKTNLSPDEILGLWREWRDSDPADMEHLWLPGVPEEHYWRLDPAGVERTLTEFWPHEGSPELEPAPATSPGSLDPIPSTTASAALTERSSATTAAPRFEVAGESFLRRLADLAALGRSGTWPIVYRRYLWAHPGRPTASVLVYHTHTTESFMPEIIPDPVERASHDPDREAFSGDPDLTVGRVGRELTRTLRELGWEVRHLETVHDYGGWQGRKGAYARSEATALAALRSLPDPVLIFDVHRDATTGRVQVGSQPAATILFVVGRQNPWWQWNYTFARHLAARVDGLSPGLSRGIRILDGRYNGDLSPLALVVEIGGADSSLAECLHSADLFAAAVADGADGP